MIKTNLRRFEYYEDEESSDNKNNKREGEIESENFKNSNSQENTIEIISKKNIIKFYIEKEEEVKNEEYSENISGRIILVYIVQMILILKSE